MVTDAGTLGAFGGSRGLLLNLLTHLMPESPFLDALLTAGAVRLDVAVDAVVPWSDNLLEAFDVLQRHFRVGVLVRGVGQTAMQELNLVQGLFEFSQQLLNSVLHRTSVVQRDGCLGGHG